MRDLLLSIAMVTLTLIGILVLEEVSEDQDGIVYAYKDETESLVETGHEIRNGEVVTIEDMDHSSRHRWHFNLPCPPISDGPITFFAGDTVVYRLSAERYEWACEEIGPGPTYFRSDEP